MHLILQQKDSQAGVNISSKIFINISFQKNNKNQIHLGTNQITNSRDRKKSVKTKKGTTKKKKK